MSGAITIYRFGPFEVDTTSGELLRQGVRVNLQDQPFRLLVVFGRRRESWSPTRTPSAASGRTTRSSS